MKEKENRDWSNSALSSENLDIGSSDL